MHVWARILLRFLLTILLIWAMATYMPSYIGVTGGWKAWVIIAALITLMNLLVTPVLEIIVLPLRFFATILAIILVNGLFLWLTMKIVGMMEPSLVTMEIRGGILGWVVVALVLGLGKWLMKVMLK